MNEDHLGRSSSNTLVIALVSRMVWAIFAGFIYDKIGRKVPISVSVILGALFVFILPETAPSMALLILNRVLIMITQTQLDCNPLIADYVKQASRGKAAAM